jgi:hypothetical protein
MHLRALTVVAVVAVLTAGFAHASPIGPAAPPRPVGTSGEAGARPSTKTALASLAALPMRFEENVGQTDARVRYLARGRGYTVFVTETETMLALAAPATRARAPEAGKGAREAARATAVRMTWPGASPEARVMAERPLEVATHYLVGDRDAWRTNVASYERVRVEGVYEGVDALLYGNGESLEYDFEVKPGADARQIRIKFEGAEKMHVDERGEVVMALAGGELRQLAPEVYQQGAAGKERVAARYELVGEGEVALTLAAYDRARPLTIDPVIVFAGYLGGSSGGDRAAGIALDAAGIPAVAGNTSSTNFPTTPGAYDASYAGGDDVFVAKLNPTGTGLAFATYFGGSFDDTAGGVAVDASGAVYACGTTLGIVSGFDAFVLKLSPTGQFVYLRTFGGGFPDYGTAIAVDASGAAYVVGITYSQNFPVTAGAFDTTYNGGSDGFVAKLSPSGSSFVYATYLGGTGNDEGRAIALDASGAATVAGTTATTSGFPTTPGAFDTTYNGGFVDTFVTRLNAAGSGLVYSGILGGEASDFAAGVAVDASGAACVTGLTDSPNFPVTSGAYTTTTGLGDCFVAKIAPDGGSYAFATHFGGSSGDSGYAIAVDAGAIYVVGQSDSSDYPTTGGALDTTYGGGVDVVVSKLSADGSQLLYSTFHGGNRNEYGYGVAVRDGAIYVAGETASGDFPALFATPRGRPDNSNAFVVKIAAGGAALDFALGFGGDVGSSPASTNDAAAAVAVDASGALYLAGQTASINFPTTTGSAFPVSDEPSEAFVAKLAPGGGSLVYATFLGGSASDAALDVAVDASGAACVTGRSGSTDFPTTPGAFAGGSPGPFVAKLAPSGGALAYSACIPDDGGAGNAIAVDASGAAYVGGTIVSAALSATPGAFDTTWNGNADGFVVKVAPGGGSLVYATYMGGSSLDEIFAIAVDAGGTATIAGDAFSPDFPATAGAFDSTHNGSSDAFVARLDPNGAALLFSTFLGDAGAEVSSGLAVDASGASYAVGTTTSSHFPTTPGAYDTSADGQDAFVTKLSADGASLVYSTFLGGGAGDAADDVAIGADGSATVVGGTDSSNLPTTAGAFDATYNGGSDGFVARFDPSGGALLYSSYFGGPSFDRAYGVAAAPSGLCYAVGTSSVLDFATTGIGSRDDSSIFVFALAPAADTVAIYDPATGAWFVRNSNTSGGANAVFTFGAGGAGLRPLAADWDGDGRATPGLYDPATGAFFLRNSASSGPADLVFTFGAGGAGFVPLAGDWDGDGTDTVGLYAPATGAFFLTNTNANGGADVVFTFGGASATAQPIAGDWNGDGTTTIGLYDRATGAFFLRNSNASGPADAAFVFGAGGAETTAVVGDWNGDGVDTIGFYTTVGSVFFLRNANGSGGADLTFAYGAGGVPVAGSWAG